MGSRSRQCHVPDAHAFGEAVNAHDNQTRAQLCGSPAEKGAHQQQVEQNREDWGGQAPSARSVQC